MNNSSLHAPTGAAVATKERFVLIDALRGVAALGVVFFHVVNTTIMGEVYQNSWPRPLLELSKLGAYGVSIFFVLSGLVIAHSLRDLAWTPQTVGNFILRRQIRLDPPYWAALVLTLLMGQVERMLPGLTNSNPASGTEILLNFLYLQGVTHIRAGSLMPVAWTLCIEIQFYLLFILLLTLGHLAPRIVKWPAQSATTALIFLSGIASLVASHFYADRAWFYSFWFHFAAGVLVYRVKRGDAATLLFHLYMVCFAIAALAAPRNVINDFLTLSFTALLVGWLTAYFLFIADRKNKLSSWGKSPFLQYFGAISYSLYLMHSLVYINLLKVGYKLTGNNALAALFWLGLAMILSVGVAHLFYRWVEKPSIALAAKWKKSASNRAAAAKSNSELSALDLPG